MQNNENSTSNYGKTRCCSSSGKWIWVLLPILILGVLFAKKANRKVAGASSALSGLPAASASGVSAAAMSEYAAQTTPLPRLLDLGARSCVPCKMMMPILDELRRTYSDKMDVEFIDIRENPDAGKEHGIKVMPTQVFFDTAGKELFRHEGFLSKDDILAKWKELGVSL